MNLREKLTNRCGFTVAEMLVIAFIFIIITSVVLANFRRGEQRSHFLLITEELASHIRQMQTQSLTGIIEEEIVATGGYGLYFTADSESQYLLFRDDGNQQYDLGTDTILETVELPSGITIANLTTNPLTIVFKPPKPTVYVNGAQAINEIQVTLNSDKVDNKEGVVSLQRITGRVTAQLVDF